MEYHIFETLLRRRGQICSHARLDDVPCSRCNDIDRNAVKVHIPHLQRELARG